jgi:hypothetical protein
MSLRFPIPPTMATTTTTDNTAATTVPTVMVVTHHRIAGCLVPRDDFAFLLLPLTVSVIMINPFEIRNNT